MESDPIKQLIERAKADPEFFHALVFDPDKAIGQMASLDRTTKGTIMQLDPERLISTVLLPDSCTGTCGDYTCDFTCGSRSCSTTCSNSCGGITCRSSCKLTIQLT